MRILRKIFRVLFYVLGIILSILVICIILLRIPAIQTKIAHIATEKLSKQLNSRIAIDKVSINFIDNVSLKGVYIEDQEKDTMLYAGKLRVDIGFFKIFKRNIDLENITIEDATIHLKQSADSLFNYQFIIDHFASSDSTTTPSKPYVLDIRKISLQNIKMGADLLNSKNVLSLHSLKIKLNQFDIGTLLFDIKSLDIDKLLLTSVGLPPPVKASGQSLPKPGKLMEFPLRNLPLNLRCEDLKISNSKFIYENGLPNVAKHFTTDHILADNLNLSVKNLLIDKDTASASIRNISVFLNRKFNLHNLQSDLLLTDKKTEIKDLKFAANESKGKINMLLNYDKFPELTYISKNVVADIRIDSLLLNLQDLAYFVPSIETSASLKPYLNDKLNLQAHITGTTAKVTLADFHAMLANTKINASGDIMEITDIHKLMVSGGKIDVSTTVRELKNLLPKGLLKPTADRLGHITLNTSVNGTLNNLAFKNLNLTTQGNLQTRFSGTVHNLLDANKLSYDLEIADLHAGYEGLLAFTDSLPKILEGFESIIYKGHLKATLNQYTINGGFNTTLGDINADLFLDFNQKYSNANYKGTVDIIDFDLAQLLSNDSLGKVSLQATVDGGGLTLPDLNTSLVAAIHNFDYNSYRYTNINIDGHVISKQFDGDIAVKDPNIMFGYSGLINLNDSLPRMDFTATLDTLNTKPLHLTPYPLHAHLAINADLTGNTVDDIIGAVVIKDIQLANESDKWATDSITFTSTHSNEKNERSLNLNAPFIQMDISGNYTVKNLSKIVTNFGDQYFPFSKYIGGKQPGDVIPQTTENQLKDEKINFSLVVRDPVKLTNIFHLDLKKLDSAKVTFTLDAPEKLLNFDLSIPEIQYGSIYANKISITADNKANNLKSLLTVDSVSVTKTVNIPGIKMEALFADRKADIGLFLEDDTGGYSLGINTKLEAPQNDLLVSIVDPFYLNSQKWDVSPKEPFTFKKGQVDFPSITLSRVDQKLMISGDTSELAFGFTNFDLNNIFELVEIDSTSVTGDMNGKLNVGLSKTKPLFTGDLDIKSIQVNEHPIGDLALKGENIGNSAKATIIISGNENDIKADANYDLATKVVNGKIDINKLSLPSFESFFRAYAAESSGSLNGTLAVSGTLTEPEVNGNIVFDNASALIKPLGTKYTINSGSIHISPEKIQPDLRLVDQNNNEAFLKGSITHHYFSDMAYDLHVNAESFTFLNSEKQSDQLFYGKFVAKLNATITGNSDLPKIVASVTTLDETDLTVQLISTKSILNQEKYIVFFNGDTTYTYEQIDSIANARYKVNSAYDLTVNATITDKAILRLVIDPLTGDNLEIKGEGDLVMKIPENGDLLVNGVYTVKEGNYRFSYQKFLKRNFGLIGGSRITFSGDPMNARLDLKAKYETEASTYSLVENELSTLSASETKSLRKKSDVTVLLNISGKLSEPELHFDIQVPDNSNSPIGSSVERAINRMKQNESELNKQVFSLLLFNSFTGTSSYGNITSTGESTAIKSVGSLVNSQLNKLAGKAEGLEINFDLDQYQDQLSTTGSNVTEIDLGVSQALFNDKLVISVGGNVGLESNTPEQQALSNVTGDFVLEYKITENGKYRVRVFQKADYDALNGDNVWKTGAGFSYQTKFGKLRKKKDEH